MNFFSKSQTVYVSRISKAGWWIENCHEFVSEGTALGSEFTQIIYTPSKDGMIARYHVESASWEDEIESMIGQTYYDSHGYQYSIKQPDGKYPNWAILEKPPIYDSEKSFVRYQDGHWFVFQNKFGQVYYDATGQEQTISVNEFQLPDGCTLTPPPDSKEGYVLRWDDEQWVYIEDHRESLIYSLSDCTDIMTIHEVGSIPSGWTLTPPQTTFDQWIDGQWVTDTEAQYIAQFNEVDNTRRQLYKNGVDPLMAEAAIKAAMGDDEQAKTLQTQAIALRQKIQSEHPYPSN